MTSEPSRFTSDRRRREGASWKDDGDWAAGVSENLDVVEGGLVPRRAAKPGVLLEGFESGSINSAYGGGTTHASIQNSPVYAGDHSMELMGEKYNVISRTDLAVERGGVYSGLVMNKSVSSSTVYQREAGIIFMAQKKTATPGGYYIELRQDDNNVIVYKSGAGEHPATDAIATEPLSQSLDTWYELVFEPRGDGTEVYRINDVDGVELAAFSTADGTFDAGGIGFSHGGDSDEHQGQFDEVRQWG